MFKVSKTNLDSCDLAQCFCSGGVASAVSVRCVYHVDEARTRLFSGALRVEYIFEGSASDCKMHLANITDLGR